MRMRPARPDDDAAIADVVSRAFGDEGPTIAALLGQLAAAGHPWRRWWPRFTRRSVRIRDVACQVALLPAQEPWMTGALVYGDPFWVKDAVGLRDPLLAEWESS
jgi:hypothetical protein